MEVLRQRTYAKGADLKKVSADCESLPKRNCSIKRNRELLRREITMHNGSCRAYVDTMSAGNTSIYVFYPYCFSFLFLNQDAGGTHFSTFPTFYAILVTDDYQFIHVYKGI